MSTEYLLHPKKENIVFRTGKFGKLLKIADLFSPLRSTATEVAT